MSLLDDVSIVVTPNGYKAGELYAVVPVPTFGADVVEDGNFPYPNTVWGGDASTVFAEGSATLTGVGAFKNLLTQTTILESGKLYEVTYTCDLSGVTSGSLKLQAFSDSSALRTVLDGTNTVELTANGTTLYIGEGGMSGTAIFTNISVKEVLVPSADMDVTRATAATRVDENGLVNYAEIIGGEEVTCGDFECAVPTDSWSTGTGWTISGGKAIYTGTANASLNQSNALISGKFYKLQYEVISSSLDGNFKISGVTESAQSPLSQSVGTHTVYFTADGSSPTNIALRVVFNTTGTLEIDNVSVKEVTRDNVPRIDYTGGGCPHILAEPQRTNLITYSEDFSNAYWIKSGASVTSGFTSPDGTDNAFKLVEDTSTGNHILSKSNFFTPDGNTRDFSIFVKEGERRYIFITNVYTINNDINCVVFDTRDGVFTNTNDPTYILSRNVTALENSWYRIDFTNNTNTGAYDNFFVGISSSGTMSGASYTGDGTSGLYIWGAQTEVGSYPTSYIPTSGSTVTRNQDIFTRDGIGSLINSTEGVLFVEIAALSNDSTYRLMNIRDVSNTDNFIYLGYKDASNTIRTRIEVGGVASTDMEFVLSNETEFNKIAIKWKTNDFALWVNGVEVATDSSGVSFTANTLDELSFDRNGSLEFNGKVKQLQVYDTSLSDTQLAALTS